MRTIDRDKDIGPKTAPITISPAFDNNGRTVGIITIFMKGNVKIQGTFGVRS